VIYFATNWTGRFEIFKMSSEGGEATQITTNGGTVSHESLDGQYLYYAKSHLDGGPRGIWRMPLGGGEEIQVEEHAEFRLCDVLTDGICSLNWDSQPPVIEPLNLTNGEVSQVAALEGQQPDTLGFSVSPDGRWILYTQMETESDIMLVENFR
jgi:Tol biopolymer transport system component